jgi:hypothetical protein
MLRAHQAGVSRALWSPTLAPTAAPAPGSMLALPLTRPASRASWPSGSASSCCSRYERLQSPPRRPDGDLLDLLSISPDLRPRRARASGSTRSARRSPARSRRRSRSPRAPRPPRSRWRRGRPRWPTSPRWRRTRSEDATRRGRWVEGSGRAAIWGLTSCKEDGGAGGDQQERVPCREGTTRLPPPDRHSVCLESRRPFTRGIDKVHKHAV